MSLGFLTESALLPQKGKDIKVDGSSMVDLKAIVFESELKKAEKGKLGSRFRKRKRKDMTSRNPNVEERAARDKLLSDDERAKKRRAAECLRQKALLYDKLVERSITQDVSSHKAADLIDFDQKHFEGHRIGGSRDEQEEEEEEEMVSEPKKAKKARGDGLELLNSNLRQLGKEERKVLDQIHRESETSRKALKDKRAKSSSDTDAGAGQRHRAAASELLQSLLSGGLSDTKIQIEANAEMCRLAPQAKKKKKENRKASRWGRPTPVVEEAERPLHPMFVGEYAAVPPPTSLQSRQRYQPPSHKFSGSNSVPIAQPQRSQSQPDSNSLGPDWMALVDAATGKPYYFNPFSGERREGT